MAPDDVRNSPVPHAPLESLGLNRVAELVYRALLEAPELDLEGIAARLGLDRGDVEQGLDDLADIALLDREASTEDGWTVADPELRLGAILAAEEAAIRSRWQSAQHAREQIAELSQRYRTAGYQGLQDIEHLVGLDEVRRRLAGIAESTQFEVFSFAPSGPQAADILHNSRELDSETLARGVRMRTIYVESIRNSQETMRYARWLVKSGAEVRTVPTLPLRMIIADRSLAVIPFSPAEPRQGALIVRHPGIVGVCLALFDQVWQSASELTSAVVVRENPEEGPSAQERELLRLLGLGHADEYVARQLGVSLRTVRRMMAVLMRRMGVKSRFQAGAQAANLDWLAASQPVSGAQQA